MDKLSHIASALIILTMAHCAYAGEAEIRKTLTDSAPQIKIVSIAKSPYAGLYQVVTEGYNIFYTDEKGEIGFFGKLVDLKNRQDITEQEKDKISYIDFSKLPLDKAIVRVKGNGSRKLALFSDPECPFCQGLELELEKVKDVTIYTFLLPLTDLHPGALRKSQLIWCAKDKAKAWEDMLVSHKEPTDSNTTCATPINEIAEVAKKAYINGTPGIVFSSGKLLFGNQDSERIASLLGEPTIKH
jgi:thiol:disulfide interchange protein DsbC